MTCVLVARAASRASAPAHTACRLIVLENERQDLDPLPVTIKHLEKLALHLPEGFLQFGKGRAEDANIFCLICHNIFLWKL